MHVNVVSGLDPTNDQPSARRHPAATGRRRAAGQQPFGAAELARAQLDLGEGQQQRRILARAVLVEELARAGEIPCIERGLRQHRPGPAFERVDADKLLERVDGLGGAPLLDQIVVQRLEPLAGFLLLAHLLESAGGGEPGLEVRRVDGAQLDDDLGRAAAIALGASARGDRVQMGLRVGKQALPRRDVGELDLRGLVLGLELEDLLVERGGLGIEALVDEVLGDPHVLPDRLLRLAGPGVELAERVGRAPVARKLFDDRQVFHNRRFEATLAEELLRLFQRSVTVEGQRDSPRAGDARESRDMLCNGSGHPIKQRGRSERPPVHVGIAEARDGVQVIPRRIPLVPIEPVARVQRVQLEHHPVPCDFRHNRRRGDGCASSVALLDRALGHRQIRNAERIDDDEVRIRHQPEHRALHGPQRCLTDVDAVDFFAVGGGDRP